MKWLFVALLLSAWCTVRTEAITPHVPDTAAPAALPAGGAQQVVRDGYARAGDARALTYERSAQPCVLADRAGDGAAANGGCWIAESGQRRADIREWGADPRGLRSSALAFAAIARLPGALLVTFPPGRFRLPCSAAARGFVFGGDVSFAGAGRDRTVIALDPGCRLVGDHALFRWDGRSHIRISGLTLDLATPRPPAEGLFAALDFRAYAASAHDISVRNVAIIGGVTGSFLLSFGAAGGHMLSDLVVTRSRFVLAAPAHTQNQCLGLSTVNGSGHITDFAITRDVCINAGMQIDGDHGTVANNDIAGFAFGTGIFFAFSTGARASCHDVSATGNFIHDSPVGLDVNNTAAGGMEVTCPHSKIRHNVLHDLGGAGIVNFGNDTLIEDNVAYDNGRNGNRGAGGIGDQAGFFLNVSAAAEARNARVTLRGNVAYDDRAGTQRYGYVDNAMVRGPITLSRNRFSGATAGVRINSLPGVVHIR